MFGFRDYDDDYEEAGSSLGGFVLGVVVGAAAALLLAPKRGEELRQDLGQNAEKLKSQGSELLETAKSKGSEVASQAQTKIGDLKGGADKATDGAGGSDAVEAVISSAANTNGPTANATPNSESKLQAHLGELEAEQPSHEIGPDEPSPERIIPRTP